MKKTLVIFQIYLNEMDEMELTDDCFLDESVSPALTESKSDTTTRVKKSSYEKKKHS